MHCSKKDYCQLIKFSAIGTGVSLILLLIISYLSQDCFEYTLNWQNKECQIYNYSTTLSNCSYTPFCTRQYKDCVKCSVPCWSVNVTYGLDGVFNTNQVMKNAKSECEVEHYINNILKGEIECYQKKEDGSLILASDLSEGSCAVFIISSILTLMFGTALLTSIILCMIKSRREKSEVQMDLLNS